MGRQLPGLRGAGRAGWQDAQPTHVSQPLHLSREFSSFSLLPAWCGRSGAEKRTPAGRLKRKWICKGRAKGVFSSQKFPNLSILLQLYDCSPLGMRSKRTPFLLHQNNSFTSSNSGQVQTCPGPSAPFPISKSLLIVLPRGCSLGHEADEL